MQQHQRCVNVCRHLILFSSELWGNAILFRLPGISKRQGSQWTLVRGRQKAARLRRRGPGVGLPPVTAVRSSPPGSRVLKLLLTRRRCSCPKQTPVCQSCEVVSAGRPSSLPMALSGEKRPPGPAPASGGTYSLLSFFRVCILHAWAIQWAYLFLTC
jgi:hypothetical protein